MILWKLFSTFRQRQPGPCDILMTFCRTPLSALIMVPAFHFKVGLLTGFAGHVWSDRSAAGQQRRLNYFTSVRGRLTSDTNNNNMTSYPYRIWCQANQTLMQQIALLQAAGALSASHGRVVRPTKGLKHKQNSHCVTNYGGTF